MAKVQNIHQINEAVGIKGKYSRPGEGMANLRWPEPTFSPQTFLRGKDKRFQEMGSECRIEEEKPLI